MNASETDGQEKKNKRLLGLKHHLHGLCAYVHDGAVSAAGTPCSLPAALLPLLLQAAASAGSAATVPAPHTASNETGAAPPAAAVGCSRCLPASAVGHNLLDGICKVRAALLVQAGH